ncbi:CD151 antigen-like [Frieseomelitta varia]|uniref:CD151 antigen-like n=1 Tax=Frieseomelitta varia TaxID=561572 RepID=UPI001CB6A0BA|nr:CD151 antigen-like [Frieseomelitta varia]
MLIVSRGELATFRNSGGGGVDKPTAANRLARVRARLFERKTDRHSSLSGASVDFVSTAREKERIRFNVSPLYAWAPLSGLVVGGIGIWTVISKHSYVSLMTTSTYPALAYALIVAGVLAVVGSWLGCGGVTSENRCVLLIYVFVVMLVFVLEAGVGALARLYEEQVGPELKMNLNRTFLENYAMRRKETSAIDQMQIEVSTDDVHETRSDTSARSIASRG